MGRRAGVTLLAPVVLSALTGLLSGCDAFTPRGDAVQPHDVDGPVAATATVERRTILDVMTVPAVAVAQPEYELTASARGLLRESDGRLVFVSEKGVTTMLRTESSTLVEQLVADGTEVGEGTPLLRMRFSGIALRANLTPAQVMRLADRAPSSVHAQIDGASGPFECALADPRPTYVDGDYAVFCAVPVAVPSVVGATAKIALRLGDAENVRALPLEAVAGTRAEGRVYVDGEGGSRPIELGLTDGVYIQVVSGLEVGDVVKIPSPSILGDG